MQMKNPSRKRGAEVKERNWNKKQGACMGLLSSDKLIIGYDLGDDYSQISFADSVDGEVETLSQVAGEQAFNIPAVLCKRFGTNQWLYGREALRCAEEEQGILVENLLTLARNQEPVIIEGESFDPVALLTLFFKRSLRTLPKPLEKITSLMLTCSTYDQELAQVLGRMVEGAQLKAGIKGVTHVALQSHAESYYSYMLRQPRELWNGQSVLFEHRGDCIRTYRMECNRRTKPMVVFVEQREYPFPEYADDAFCQIAEECIGKTVTGSVFLIGDGFAGDWMKDSLRFLCRGRRVFQGNNLFSKGACCGMQEKLEASEAGREYVFLGENKLKSNVGMKVLRGGGDSYFALLDAGTDWYVAEKTVEVYLQEGNELELAVTPLVKSSVSPARAAKGFRLMLDGLPGSIARIRLHLYMEEEDRLTVEAEDLGFGEFREATGHVWSETFQLYAAPDENRSKYVRVSVCMGAYAENPYCIPGMEMNVFCLEELCCCLKENAFLLDISLMNDELLDWLERECALRELKKILYPLVHKQGSLSAFVTAILQYGGLYDEEAVRETEQLLKQGVGLSGMEKRRKQIDYMVGKKKYKAALKGYDELLEKWNTPPEKEGNRPAPDFLAAVWHNKGVAYVGLMLYEAAAGCFLHAYELGGGEDSCINYLGAKRMQLTQEEYVAFVAEHGEFYRFSLELEKQLERAVQEWEQQPEYLRLYNRRELKESGDKWRAYEENSRLVDVLKENYRKL